MISLMLDEVISKTEVETAINPPTSHDQPRFVRLIAGLIRLSDDRPPLESFPLRLNQANWDKKALNHKVRALPDRLTGPTLAGSALARLQGPAVRGPRGAMSERLAGFEVRVRERLSSLRGVLVALAVMTLRAKADWLTEGARNV